MRATAENPSVPDFAAGNASVRDAATPATAPDDDLRDAVSLDQLSAGDRIVVTTRNHTYEIVVTSPWSASALVRGGHFFPEFTMARLAGSSLGGSALKMRSVNVGCRLELVECGSPVITTRVRAVRFIPAPAGRGVM
jgi:hypothetical protein